MNEYYFLFGLLIVWTIFAVVQDFRRREVSNWLNFSLIGFALAYRAFYSTLAGDYNFFLLGLLGFAISFSLAYMFYYMRLFAGGDAKLLMGFGAALPYGAFNEVFFALGIFTFFLFFLGSIYSVIYSFFIVSMNWKKFSKEFKKRILSNALPFLIFLIPVLIITIFEQIIGISIFAFLIFVLLLFAYFKGLDSCMLKRKDAKDLQEGDWLECDVKVGRKLIKRSVHGLSMKDIKLLSKYKKKVLIKEGIPFTPAFLLALVAMAPFFLALGKIELFSPALFSQALYLFSPH